MRKLIFTSLIILGLGCNPGSAQETTGSTEIENLSTSNTSEVGQSQTSIVVQMTTSGEPQSTDSTNSSDSSSTNPTEVNSETTIETIPICGNNILEFPE